MGIEVIVGVVGILVSAGIAVYTYRKMNPKRQLRYRVEVTPLLATGAAGSGRLTVSLGGDSVADPQIVTLTLWSTGRADISSQAFDGGIPLIFELDTKIIEVVSSEHGANPPLEVQSPSQIVLRPALLHRRFEISIRVLVDGPPRVTANRVFADIEMIRNGQSETANLIASTRRKLRITPLLVWTAILLLGSLSLIIGLVIYGFDREAYLPWGVVGVVVIMISLVAIVIIGIYRFVRWIARNVEARSGLR